MSRCSTMRPTSGSVHSLPSTAMAPGLGSCAVNQETKIFQQSTVKSPSDFSYLKVQTWTELNVRRASGSPLFFVLFPNKTESRSILMLLCSGSPWAQHDSAAPPPSPGQGGGGRLGPASGSLCALSSPGAVPALH